MAYGYQDLTQGKLPPDIYSKMLSHGSERAKMIGQELNNVINRIKGEHEEERLKGEIAHTKAQTGLLGEQAKYYGPKALADIASTQAQTRGHHLKNKSAAMDLELQQKLHPAVLKALEEQWTKANQNIPELYVPPTRIQSASGLNLEQNLAGGPEYAPAGLPNLEQSLGNITPQQMQQYLNLPEISAPARAPENPANTFIQGIMSNPALASMLGIKTASAQGFAPSALGKLVQERNQLAAMDPNSPLLADYDRAIKAQGAGKSYAPSALGKLSQELQEVEEGFLPGSHGTVPISPEQQESLRDKYLMQIQKANTDAATRTTVLRGQNLLKSINASNIDDLTRYSGPKGQFNLKKEQAKDLTGNPSKEYLSYLEALQAVKLEAKELRQFFGDSITPQAAQAIDEMVNATAWNKSPEAAKRMILKSRDTIKKQIQTFEKGLQTVDAYRSGAEQTAAENDPLGIR